MNIADRRRAHFLEWLEASEWNAKSLAEHVGIPYTTLHSYVKEAGKPGRSLRGDNEAQIAAALGLTIEQLFGSSSNVNFVKEWRLAKEWLPDELADKSGYPVEFIQGIEAGEIPVSPKILRRLADAFGTTEGRLQLHPSDVDHEAAELFAGLGVKDKTRAIEMLRVIQRTGTEG